MEIAHKMRELTRSEMENIWEQLPFGIDGFASRLYLTRKDFLISDNGTCSKRVLNVNYVDSSDEKKYEYREMLLDVYMGKVNIAPLLIDNRY